MPNRWVTIGIIAVLIVTCFSSVGLYLFARDPYSERQIRELIDKAYAAQRPGGGRLSGTAYSRVGTSSPVRPELGTAQIILLRQPDSDTRQRLQGLVYLAAGDWQHFIEISRHAHAVAGDSATSNNLGASFLALSDKDPTLLLNALDAFERAAQLDPRAPEPLFNLVITYRKLHFPKPADDALQRYVAIDASSPWNRELKNPAQIDEALVLDQLEKAAENKNPAEAERLFEANPELCRRVVMQFALLNDQVSPALLHFIAAQMERRYGDKTLTAMLAPLFTDRRDSTISLRDFVNQGADLYKGSNFKESLAAYDKASKLATQTDSVFDRLWIDLNKADTQIKMGQFEEARKSLALMISISRKQGFVWLTAKALSIYGSSVTLTDSYGEMLNLLSEADHIFTVIDAPHDRIRVLYSLAYRYGAGDQDEGLRRALECLRLINDQERSRISTLDWLIGSILYRRQMPEKAILFAKASVEQSQNDSSPTVQATTATSLGELYESLSQHRLADQYFKIAEDAFQNIPEGFDRTRSELLLDVAKARSDIDQKQYGKAESLLRRSLEIYYQQPFPATPLLSQALMLSAQVYSETGRTGEAARKFSEAIDVVENDDDYLKSEGLRVKFDDDRRELYDSAIEFEFGNGSYDAAWTYLQKYRAKLFLEFLAAFNPDIEQSHARVDRAVVQRRVPNDTQIIEYVLLKDRLLIWLVTDKIFIVRSVEVKRADLESKVQVVLAKLRTGDDVDLLLSDLGKLLIEPIANLLDPDRTITIIPDRALHGLPFAALKRPGSGRYLVQDFPIVVSPSLTHFLAASAAQPRRDSIVGFGSQNGGAAELKELASLKDVYPNAETFSGLQVDKTSFLAQMSRAAVFHYAGHSATDAVDPLRSSILLDGNRSGPNSVTAVDIAQQHLVKNAVVILSSCDSSVGNSRDGIGVRGLTSAFLIGGAGSVVGSLWPVEASSTADLMIRFHRAFASSQMPVAKALRQAQLTFLQSFPGKSHPYYWSGFVVTGNFSALR